MENTFKLPLVGVFLLNHGKGGFRQSSLNQKLSLIQGVLHHCSFGTQRLWNQMPWVTNLRTNLSKACLVLTPEGILCTRNDCCSMVCSHTMAVSCTLRTNMILFVLYFNFFPHLEILGGSQFGYFNFFPYLWFLGGPQFKLRNFRGVPVGMFGVFYLPKKTCDF